MTEIIGIIEIIEIIEIKIVSALETIVRDTMTEKKIDITNEVRVSSVDLQMMNEDANRIEVKREKIEKEGIIDKKNTDYYEI